MDTTTVSVVTGAASGIGLALATELARRGGHVVLADLDAERARQEAARVDASWPGSARAVELDVADADAVARTIASTHDAMGRLDHVFNNAGIGPPGTPADLGLEHWNRTVDVNLRGVIHGCHAAWPIMLEQGHGHIVNTASLAGLVGGGALSAPYVATKHGIVGLSLALHAAGAPHGIRVTAVCPGGVDTPLVDRDAFDGLDTVPSGRGASARRLAELSGMPISFVPPERIAKDVLRAMSRGRALAVTPASARLAWRLYRLAPGAMLRAAIAIDRRIARRRAEAT